MLASGRFIFGPEVEGFEREAADFLGVEHAVGVANGTDALVLVLDALGIGAGDEVVCPSFTFYATAEAIARVGGTPVFADIDPSSLNLDPEEGSSGALDLPPGRRRSCRCTCSGGRPRSTSSASSGCR